MKISTYDLLALVYIMKLIEEPPPRMFPTGTIGARPPSCSETRPVYDFEVVEPGAK